MWKFDFAPPIFKAPDIRDKARVACGQRTSKNGKEVFRKDKKTRKNNRVLKK